MEIIEVKQNWPDDLLHVEICVGNICNYQCWYCYPESSSGSVKWPNYNTLVRNLSHLFDHYKATTNKRRFSLNLLGGEVTHWKRFIDFTKYFKENYDCVITLKTNASKKLEWWKQAAPYLSRVSISHHQDFSNAEHNRAVADYLYEQRVMTNIHVMMDPHKWDECLDAVEYYKGSKHWWSIRQTEIVHSSFEYTEAQRETLKTLRPRGTNPLYFLLFNKMPRSKTKVVTANKKTTKVDDNFLVLQRLNTFTGWQCSVGKDFLGVLPDGTLSGLCGNELYNQSKKYNLFDQSFVEEYRPIVISTICNQTNCWCDYEVNMPKKKVTKHRVIPIYAN